MKCATCNSDKAEQYYYIWIEEKSIKKVNYCKSCLKNDNARFNENPAGSLQQTQWRLLNYKLFGEVPHEPPIDSVPDATANR